MPKFTTKDEIIFFVFTPPLLLFGKGCTILSVIASFRFIVMEGNMTSFEGVVCRVRSEYHMVHTIPHYFLAPRSHTRSNNDSTSSSKRAFVENFTGVTLVVLTLRDLWRQLRQGERGHPGRHEIPQASQTEEGQRISVSQPHSSERQTRLKAS